MASLQLLWLQENAIGDAGMSALASACAKGALAQCTFIGLGGNQIGDVGLTALALACASGALDKVAFIHLDHSRATETGKKAMRDVSKTRGFRVDLA